ncbi:MAG: hypothetical protein OXB93_04740 [Cytophagales bacterium]|nr:hypothetical protein [Cytophagales bacterium]
MTKRVLLSFSSDHPKYRKAQAYQNLLALQGNYFDHIFPYTPEDLGLSFHLKHRDILRHRRGYGYWIWKPYIVLKTMDLLEEGDMIFYCDVDRIFKASPKPFFDLLSSIPQAILPLSHPSFLEYKYSKSDLMGCLTQGSDGLDLKKTPQIWAGAFVIQKESSAKSFLLEWYGYASEEHFLSETASYLYPSSPEFINHRHDQSIYSLLVKKHRFRYYILGEEFLSHRDTKKGYGVFNPDIQNILQERPHFASLPIPLRWIYTLRLRFRS